MAVQAAVAASAAASFQQQQGGLFQLQLAPGCLENLKTLLAFTLAASGISVQLMSWQCCQPAKSPGCTSPFTPPVPLLRRFVALLLLLADLAPRGLNATRLLRAVCPLKPAAAAGRKVVRQLAQRWRQPQPRRCRRRCCCCTRRGAAR